MKKVLSVFLALTLLLACAAPMVASAARVSCPVVYVGGQESTIYSDKNDENSKTYYTGALPEEELTKITSGLRAALIKGMSPLTGNWTDYEEGFYNAAIPYYSEIILNNKGLPINKTGYDCLKEKTLVNKGVNGRYGLTDYKFIYDWRLDPCANAKELNAYIDSVLAVTGAQKVDIVAVGVGCSTVLAYMQANGSAKISELVLDNAALNGSDVYGAMFSGKVTQDPDALATFVAEVRRNVALVQVLKRNISPENWDNDIIVGGYRTVYGRIFKNIVPRIVRDVYGTMPGMWSLIGDDYYEDAIDYIFSDYEYAAENKVLIDQLNAYHYNVQKNTETILRSAVRAGVHVYNIVNYGFIMVPVNEKSNVTSDGYVSVPSATLGATVPAGYGEKLSEEYVALAKQEAQDAYISPDGEIDAATGFAPAHTWFVKNLENGDVPACVNDLIVSILNFNGYTNVFDLEDAPQYLYCENDMLTLVPLTAYGTGTETPVETDEDPESASTATGFGRILDFIRKFIFNIVSLVRNLIDFGQSNPFTGAIENAGNGNTDVPSDPAPAAPGADAAP